MIFDLPREWHVTTTVDGAVIDTPAGRMLYVATSPLVRARVLVSSRLAWRPGYALTKLERMVTAEGEFAVLAHARAPDASREIAWGIVFADESLAYYELDAPREHAERGCDTVALAARYHRFALGLRWRRYRYAVPDHYDAIARGLVTDWYAPRFPRDWAVLTAYPALPAAGQTLGIVPSLVLNAKAQGLVIGSEQPFVPESRYGLAGVGTMIEGTFGGHLVKLQIAAFLDDRYVYAMELQSRTLPGWTEQHRTFASTLASIEYLPRPHSRLEED